MSTLQRLRGEPKFCADILGQTLTFYRQGIPLGLAVGLATFIVFQLPWNLVSTGGQVLQVLATLVGCYTATTLMASRAPAGTDAAIAASRWL